MTQPPQQPHNPPSSLDRWFAGILSIAGLIGAALFFSGYVYRWAYFSYYLINLTDLNFPAETYPIVPIQIFCGTLGLLLRTVGFILLGAVGIRSVLWGLQQGETWTRGLANQAPRSIRGMARWLAELTHALSAFLREATIVLGILTILFWASRWQGTADARRDAYTNTSTLPTIALVMSEEGSKVALGRSLSDATLDPSLQGFRLFGDRSLFNEIYRKEDSNPDNLQNPRIWRILSNQGQWIYLFSSLPGSPGRGNERPLVLGIQQTGGEQQLILGPAQED